MLLYFWFWFCFVLFCFLFCCCFYRSVSFCRVSLLFQPPPSQSYSLPEFPRYVSHGEHEGDDFSHTIKEASLKEVFFSKQVLSTKNGLHPTGIRDRNENLKPRPLVDFVFNLEPDFRWKRLAGLDVEKTVICHSLPSGYLRPLCSWSDASRDTPRARRLRGGCGTCNGRSETHDVV